jgi:hypothetical protein
MTMDCSVREDCANQHKCWICQADGNGDTLYWRAKAGSKVKKHPIVEAAIKDRKDAKKADKKAVKDQRMQDVINNVVDDRKLRGKIAAQREKKTEKTLQKLAAKQYANRTARSSDGNSGRVANDDDHVILGGEIRYDTKSYSRHVHPPIDLAEYDECKAKATKHGSDAFGMVVYNKDGRAFIVFDFHQDWPYMQEKLNLTLLPTESENNNAG